MDKRAKAAGRKELEAAVAQVDLITSCQC